jgi:hypothetical protein
MIATRVTRIRRIYADFALPAAKFFSHQGTKTQSPLNRKCFLCAFVPWWLFYHHAEGGIKIRVNPPNPRHPRCYCVAFEFNCNLLFKPTSFL